MRNIFRICFFLSVLAYFPAKAEKICEIAEVDGGLFVVVDGKANQIWRALQNIVIDDIRALAASDKCVVVRGDCEITESNGGLTVLRDGKRVSGIWSSNQNHVRKDLMKLIEVGVCSITPKTCEVRDVRGGRTVLRDGKRVSEIWNYLEERADIDLSHLESNQYCLRPEFGFGTEGRIPKAEIPGLDGFQEHFAENDLRVASYDDPYYVARRRYFAAQKQFYRDTTRRNHCIVYRDVEGPDCLRNDPRNRKKSYKRYPRER